MPNFDGLFNSKKVANVEKVRHVLNYCDDKCASACVDRECFQLQWKPWRFADNKRQIPYQSASLPHLIVDISPLQLFGNMTTVNPEDTDV